MLFLSFGIYMAVVGTCMTGFYLMQESARDMMRFDNRILTRGKLIINRQKSRGIIEELIPAGYEIKKWDYEFCRAGICICLALFTPATGNRAWLLMAGLLYLLSFPACSFKGYSVPFGAVVNTLIKRREEKKEDEIYEGICFIRNYIAVNPVMGSGTDYVLEQLIMYADVLKPAYIKLLNLVRTNNRADGLRVFSQEAGEKYGKDYGRLLLQLDEMPVSETEETLITYQSNLRDIRITRIKKRDEIISDIIYMPVVINMLLIFVNFVYVAYFIEQKEALSMLF